MTGDQNDVSVIGWSSSKLSIFRHDYKSRWFAGREGKAFEREKSAFREGTEGRFWERNIQPRKRNPTGCGSFHPYLTERKNLTQTPVENVSKKCLKSAFRSFLQFWSLTLIERAESQGNSLKTKVSLYLKFKKLCAVVCVFRYRILVIIDAEDRDEIRPKPKNNDLLRSLWQQSDC